jgi:hypothetical protein
MLATRSGQRTETTLRLFFSKIEGQEPENLAPFGGGLWAVPRP